MVTFSYSLSAANKNFEICDFSEVYLSIFILYRPGLDRNRKNRFPGPTVSNVSKLFGTGKMKSLLQTELMLSCCWQILDTLPCVCATMCFWKMMTPTEFAKKKAESYCNSHSTGALSCVQKFVCFTPLTHFSMQLKGGSCEGDSLPSFPIGLTRKVRALHALRTL